MSVPDTRRVAPTGSAEDKTCENSVHLQQSALTPLQITSQSTKSEAILISQYLCL
jgi:hypothetical protein